MLTTAGKALVLILTAILLGVSIWSAVKLEMDFNYEWFTPDDSYLIDTYNVRDRYWDSTELPGMSYSRNRVCVDKRILVGLGTSLLLPLVKFLNISPWVSCPNTFLCRLSPWFWVTAVFFEHHRFRSIDLFVVLETYKQAPLPDRINMQLT